MKLIIVFFFSIATVAGIAQSNLTPGKKSFEKKWIKNDINQMTLYAMRDTAKFEIGKVTTQIMIGKKTLTVVTKVNMKNAKTPQFDTTIVNLSTLKPIYHSSYNMQRDMALNFGKIVSGFYNDKRKKQNIIVSDTTTEDYFDSNLYPVLIGWLPLKNGYKQDISIYDYNPLGRNGIIKASVKEVISGSYESLQSGIRDVWIVTVSDEIGNGNNVSTYYFDKKDRKLWKQDINTGGQMMMMYRIETN